MKSIGPYSPIVIKEFKEFKIAFISGQIPIDKNGNIRSDLNIISQTKLVLENLEDILKKNGFLLKDVVKTTVFLKDISEFELMNKVYSEFFQKIKPSRSTIEAANLPKDVKIEIEAIAIKIF